MKDPAGALVRFSHLVAAAKSPDGILPILADSAIDDLGAEATAVFQVTETGRARIVAARNLPGEMSGWEVEAEAIGPDLGVSLVRASRGQFAEVLTLPLVSGGDLYGALILLSSGALQFEGSQRVLIQGLVDLAAIAISKAMQYEELARSHAELRATRVALAKTEKLRALGQMAAGISHDLKNILNPLSLQVQVLQRRIAKGAELGDVIERMQDAIKCGVDTVERLRDFSRQEPERAAEPTDLNRVLGSALELCRPRLGMDVKVNLRKELGSPPEVLVRAAELVNAIVNLVVNAIDAFVAREGFVVARTGASDAGGWVEVEDNGPGMPPEIQRRVFEPFFTTKSEGTGLGLAMVYAFVQRHGGKITLETTVGQGTRFRLWFPAGGLSEAS